MGSFEVYFNERPVYSKIKSKKWPNAKLVLQQIVDENNRSRDIILTNEIKSQLSYN